MTKRIFRSIFCTSFLVCLMALACLIGALYNSFTGAQLRQLEVECLLATQAVTHEGMEYFDGLELSGCRITWIAADGTVIHDSESDSDHMENHLQREEIIAAVEDGHGQSVRHSTTLMEQLLYDARRLPDGSILRLSCEQDSVWRLMLGLLPPILFILLAALLLSFALASRIARQIVRPLNELNLDEPLSQKPYDELSPLLQRIESQKQQLRSQAGRLRRQQDEFDTLTDSIREGLVLISRSGHILSINRAAMRLFQTDRDSVGRHFTEAGVRALPQELVRAALSGERGSCTLPLGGSTWQMDCSPVVSEGEVRGAALVMFDITERERAERLRREFTANVSHELKTPLHTISGCAELLGNGMVQPADTAHFGRQIYQEAQRMIQLVEDIIHLSFLEEEAALMERERVDLLLLAAAEVDSLRPAAAAAGIELRMEGERVIMPGIPSLLAGIVHNLCENAVKYNKNGGRVMVKVQKRDNCALLLVADTGIGIAPEHQDRVFERFFRVDKSHSRQKGGTGLGLSIVKHAARIHHATVELESELGRGTVVTVRFPLSQNG